MQYLDQLAHLPEGLILEIESPTKQEIELSNDLNIDIHNSELFDIIFKTIKDKANAQLEIDYLCLSLYADSHYKSAIDYDGLEHMLNILKQKCLLLHSLFLEHNAYLQNKLAYTLIGIKRDKLFLQRKDLFYKQLKTELKANEICYQIKF